MTDKGALLHAIIENAIDGIITIDQRGLMESINPAACALFGYSAEEVIGKNISMLMPQPDKVLINDSDRLTRVISVGVQKIVRVKSYIY